MFPSRSRPGPTARLLAGTALLGLVLIACGPNSTTSPEDAGQQPTGGAADQPATQDDPSADQPSSDDDPAPSEGDGGGSGADDGRAPTQPERDASDGSPSEPEPTPDPDQQRAVVDDRGPLGSACRPYLRDEVPGLTIEVLHQAGARPSDGAVDHLVASLEPVLAKPAGIDLAGPREIPGRGRTWDLEALREVAGQHRRAHSSESRLGMLVLAVAGEYEDPGVLGLAMSATEIVLFPEQIGDLATSLLGGSSRIERSVLLHEAGHLLCLVNITYDSETDHEDPEHPEHSRHRDSVMFWAVPNDAVSQAFTGPPPDEFHADDLADLRGLREGTY